MSLSKQTRNFLIIGLIGLGVDMATFALFDLIAADALARIGSIAVAMTVTWQLNRRNTFDARHHKPILREYTEYVAASLFGASVNYGSYLALNSLIPAFLLSDYVFIGISSVVAAFVNFMLYKKVVFKPTKE